MKYCSKCGAACEDGVKFCMSCGAPLEQPNNAQPNGMPNNYQQPNYSQPNNNPRPTAGVVKREIVLAIILTIVTCGIYGIYWMIKMNDEINLLAGEPTATSGGMVFLLSLVTCNIYTFYWLYKMGERCDKIKGTPNGSSNILYMILAFFGLSIVSYCLMQDTINKAV